MGSLFIIIYVLKYILRFYFQKYNFCDESKSFLVFEVSVDVWVGNLRQLLSGDVVSKKVVYVCLSSVEQLSLQVILD